MRKLQLRVARMLALATLLLSAISLHSQGSVTWSASMDVAQSSYDNLHPRIAVDGSGNPLIIWGRTSDESVFISRWTGSSFSMPMKVNPSGYTVATQSWMGPDIAAQGDTVFVVVKRTPEASDTNHVFILRSLNGGMTFGNPVQVDAIADSISRFPTLDVDALGNPLVAFMKFDPSFGNARWVVAKSTDGGNSFASDQLASGWSGGTVCDCCPGSIVIDGNTACMSYRDNLNNIRDTWTGISTNGGISFGQGMPVDQGNWMLMKCPSSGPDGVIIGDSLYSVFMSQESGSPLVYLSKSSISTAQGAVGVPIIGTQIGITSQNFPRIASNGPAVAVVWRQNFNMNAQIPILFTDNIQDGFPADYDSVFVGTGMTAAVNVDVAISNGMVHVVWQDDASGTVRYRSGSFAPFVNVPKPRQVDFMLYPNPTRGAVNVLATGALLHNRVDLQVRNFAGKEVLAQNLMELPETFSISTEGWAAGVYFVSLTSDHEIFSKKLIVLPR
ncbi:MAG: T9SS type A sorting domain-containing protein [Bacteroidia bacterium]